MVDMICELAQVVTTSIYSKAVILANARTIKVAEKEHLR
jgi:hypothetical protein